MLQSEAGYINARPHLPDRGKPLATHGRTIHSGQSRRRTNLKCVARVSRESIHESFHIRRRETPRAQHTASL